MSHEKKLDAPILNTTRLEMRGLSPNDLDELWLTVGRADAMTYSLTRKESPFGGWSQAATEKFIAGCEASWQKHGFGRWGVVDKTSTRESLIGYCGLSTMDYLPMPECVELSFRLHPDYWGRGLGPEAATASLDWAFGELDVDSVVGCTMPDNIQSIKALGRLGMVYETTLPYYDPDLDQGADFAVYRVGRNDWLETILA